MSRFTSLSEFCVCSDDTFTCHLYVFGCMLKAGCTQKSGNADDKSCTTVTDWSSQFCSHWPLVYLGRTLDHTLSYRAHIRKTRSPPETFYTMKSKKTLTGGSSKHAMNNSVSPLLFHRQICLSSMEQIQTQFSIRPAGLWLYALKQLPTPNSSTLSLWSFRHHFSYSESNYHPRWADKATQWYPAPPP